jgi:hypothetical protein
MAHANTESQSQLMALAITKQTPSSQLVALQQTQDQPQQSP